VRQLSVIDLVTFEGEPWTVERTGDVSHEGRDAGWVGAELWAGDPRLHIRVVHIYENFRRQGFARAWLASVVERCREAGLEAIYLSAQDQGCHAWAHLGFTMYEDMWQLHVAELARRAKALGQVESVQQLTELAQGAPQPLALARVPLGRHTALDAPWHAVFVL
jgi:GNAT superfamily N-acetyltransferase